MSKTWYDLESAAKRIAELERVTGDLEYWGENPATIVALAIEAKRIIREIGICKESNAYDAIVAAERTFVKELEGARANLIDMGCELDKAKAENARLKSQLADAKETIAENTIHFEKTMGVLWGRCARLEARLEANSGER